MKSLLGLALCTVVFIGGVSGSALAEHPLPTDVLLISRNAPFIVHSCVFYPTLPYATVTIDSTNLNPSHRLEGMQVRVELYDENQNKTTEATVETTDMDLEAGERKRSSIELSGSHVIPIEGAHSAVCTIVSAVFEGGWLWPQDFPGRPRPRVKR